MQQPIWISHRGDHRNATENTREAFDAALSLGFDHLETDLRTCADGHIVLAHDSTLQRISQSTAQHVTIENSERAYLESLRLNSGEGLFFLDQLLEQFRQQHWIFDIKTESAVATMGILQQLAQRPEVADFFSQRVRFLFWQSQHQRTFQNLYPKANCLARLPQCRRAAAANLVGLSGFAGLQANVTYALPTVFFGIPLMQRTMIDRYHRRKAKVLAYLPETPREHLNALSAGVDEILTNDRPMDYPGP